MSDRYIRYYDSNSGSTTTSTFNFDKSKKYKLNKSSGSIEEVTSSNALEADEISIPGSKSSLRRIGDLERNVTILASKSGIAGATNSDTDTVLKTSAQALSTASNALTSSNATITLARGDGTTDVVTVNNVANASAATTATKWETARTISLSGDASGSVSIDGSANATLTVVVANNSHTHTIANVTGLQTALDAKATPAEVDTAIATAITGLVDAAPTALDTLNELAAALGDDANFSATVTTALGTKAANTITISAGTDLTGGGNLTANRTISHASVARTNTTSTQSATHSGTITVVDSITTSSTGHITGVNTKTITLPADNNTTYGAATSTVLGLIKLEDDTVQSVAANAVSATAGRTYGVQVNSSGQAVVNVPWSDTNTTYGVATTSANGLMSSTDKSKLDGIEAGATADQTKADIDALGIAASTAATLATARTIGMSGVTATATSFNGSANITIPVTAVPATLLTGTIADARISGAYTGMTNLTGSGTVDFAKFLGNAADTAALPSFSWTGDTNTGMYQPAADQLGFATGGASRAIVSASGLAVTGAITATGDVTAYSDDRLKTNVKTIEGALGKVAQVRGVTFDRIEDGSTSTGVVAQELAAVLPEAVKTDANGMHHVAYGNITGLLIEAIKELKDEIDYLKGLK